MKIKSTGMTLLALIGASMILAGCGEKVETDTTKVNEGKGAEVEVTPRNRDGGPSGEEGGGR